MLSALDQVTQIIGSATNVGAALNTVNTISTAPNGFRGASPVALVVTDGGTSDLVPLATAKATLTALGYNIYAIAIGIPASMLYNIANSNPPANNVFQVRITRRAMSLCVGRVTALLV